MSAEKSRSGRKPLVAVVGFVAASMLLALIPQMEGSVPRGYRDMAGIPTKCSGDTKDVVVGRVYSAEHCAASTEAALVRHAEPVLACTPGLRGHPNQLTAAVSLAYNIGPAAYCRSTIARRFNAGDWRGACRGFEAWVHVGGRKVQGLVNRRRTERALCERGL